MPHFYESISKEIIDPIKEMEKVRYLFFEEKTYLMGFYTTLSQTINDCFFRNLDLSGNYIVLDEYFSDIVSDGKNNSEKLVFFCEGLLSVLFQAVASKQFKAMPKFQRDEIVSRMKTVIKVVNYDLDKMCLVSKTITDKNYGELVVFVPKDPLLEDVLQENEDENVRQHLIEYKSSRNDGKIEAKEELLRLLAVPVEGITKDKKIRGLNNRLFNNVDFLLNNLDLRHNQKVKDMRFYNATKDDREKWLDLTFRGILLVFGAKTEFSDNAAIEKKKKEAGLGN